MHISLLVVAFIVMQLSTITKTPKYQKVTIRSISSGSGSGQSISNNSNAPSSSTQTNSNSERKEIPKEPVKNEVKKENNQKPEKVSETEPEKAKQENKAPPKKVKKEASKQEDKSKTTAKTVKKERGKDDTSRNSKNASLIEDALSSITEEVKQTSRKNGAVAKAIANLEGGGTMPPGNMDYGTYIDIVGTILKNQWFYPNLGRNEKLRTIIRVFVDGNGKIMNYRIERSSGREDFDISAIRAVEQYTHFPVPPNRRPVDFVVNFNLLEE